MNINFDRIDASIENDRHINESYKKAEAFLKKQRIRESGFKDDYGEDQVEKDLRYVVDHQMIFNQSLSDNADSMRDKKFATILEAIFLQNVENGKWFGRNVEIIIPSEYDEIKAGVDAITKLQEPKQVASYMALAIDVTFSKNVEKKLEKIRNQIIKGEAPEIKYFKTAEFKGKLLNIPKVVIGADRKTVKELSSNWINNENDKIAGHPVQSEILSEIHIQLKKFMNLCRTYKRDDLGDRYEQTLSIIEKIMEKQNTESLLRRAEESDMYGNIKRYMGNI